MKDNVKEEIEKKKEYLRGYRRHERRISRIEAELEEIKMMKLRPSMNHSGMPRGQKQYDLSDYMVKIDERENELRLAEEAEIRTYRDIMSRIEGMAEEDERDVLFYRYIKGMEFWEIAQQMDYSERQIHRKHGKALTNLILPEDVSSCHS